MGYKNILALSIFLLTFALSTSGEDQNTLPPQEEPCTLTKNTPVNVFLNIFIYLFFFLSNIL